MSVLNQPSTGRLKHPRCSLFSLVFIPSPLLPKQPLLLPFDPDECIAILVTTGWLNNAEHSLLSKGSQVKEHAISVRRGCFAQLG